MSTAREGTMSARILLSLLLAAVLSMPCAAQDRRVALVIGNAKYLNASELRNPINDAADIASALRDLRFEVIEGVNLSFEDMRKATLDFSQKMEGADVGLLFYAGHGIQISDRNYLVPIDANLRHARDVELGLMELDTILRQMERETNTRIIFLDACRDNPLSEVLSKSPVGSRRTIGRGLSQFVGNAETGTYIAFATRPGLTASDGEGRNSPFTGSLKVHLRNSRANISDIMVEVRKEVVQATASHQVPWDMSSLMGPFHFKAAEEPWQRSEPPTSQNGSESFLRALWDDVRAVNRIDVYQAYVEAFPDSLYARLARGHIEMLEAAQKRSNQRGKKSAGSRTLGTSVQVPNLPEVGGASPQKEPFRDCAGCPQMVWIPAGTFVMGSPPAEEGRQKNEGPQREVRVTRPLAVSSFEITIAEYGACVEANKCKALTTNAVSSPSAKLNALLDAQRAATNVSWEDARNYTQWLSERSGWQYQLLSEAEWEYAARAGSTTRYSWGDAIDPDRVHCSDCSKAEPRKYSRVIGQQPPNAFGLYDMLGNVWEWVTDCWHKTYANAEFSHWPWLERNDGDCNRRVLRGGSWANGSSQLRTAYRLAGKSGSRGELIGFRIARVDRTQERIAQFLEQTYLMGAQGTLNEIKAYYCDKVDFWGRRDVSNIAAAEQQLRQNRRWPYKSYVIIPGTLRIGAPSSEQLVDVRFEYNYRVSKTPFPAEDMKPGVRKGEARLKLQVTERQILVCGESGSTL